MSNKVTTIKNTTLDNMFFWMSQLTTIYWEYRSARNEHEHEGLFNDLIEDFFKRALRGSLYFASLLSLEIGMYWKLQKNYYKSFKILTLSIWADSTNSKALYIRGELLVELRYYKKAKIDLKKAIEVDPLYAEAYISLGQMLLLEEDFENAHAYFNQALVKISGEYEVLYRKEKIQELRENVNHFVNLSKLYVEYINSTNKPSELSSKLKDLINSIDEKFQKAILEEPKNQNVFFESLGKYYFNVKNYTKSSELFRKALSIKPSAKIYCNDAVCMIHLGQFEEAINKCDQALRIDSKYAMAMNNRGVALERLCHYKEAIKEYDKASKIDAMNFLFFYNKGSLWLKLKEYKKALKDFDEVLKIKPDNIDALNNSGVIKGRFKQFEEALENFNKVLKINPKDTHSLNNKGVLLWDMKRYSEALEIFNKVLEIDSKNMNAFNNRKAALERLDQIQEFKQDSDKELEIDLGRLGDFNN